MAVRGIRGATTARANTKEAIREAVSELLRELVQANGLSEADIVSVYFTMTRDLDAAFPASAARSLGWDQVALLDAQAPSVKDDVPYCVRVLLHCNTEHPAGELRHIYLHGARRLRPDRAWGGTNGHHHEA